MGHQSSVRVKMYWPSEAGGKPDGRVLEAEVLQVFQVEGVGDYVKNC